MKVATAARSCQREGCANSLTPQQGKYCSTGCQNAARRKHDRPAELACQVCGAMFLTSGRPPGTKYCSKPCQNQARRKPSRLIVCAHCGKVKVFHGERASKAKTSAYCSRTCSAAAQRRRIERVCQNPACGKTFEAHPYRLETHWTCSIACRSAVRHPRARRPCERCGVTFLHKGRRFCSSACRWGSDSGTIEIACRRCGKTKRGFKSELYDQYYCSRACFHASQRRQVEIRCKRPGCGARKLVAPSRAALGAKYCSRRCFYLAIAPREYTCKACGATFPSSPSRHQVYCNQACRNRGRVYQRRPRLAERNLRILELHVDGMKAPAIRRVLEAEGRQPMPETGTIRSVISRDQRAGRAQARLV